MIGSDDNTKQAPPSRRGGKVKPMDKNDLHDDENDELVETKKKKTTKLKKKLELDKKEDIKLPELNQAKIIPHPDFIISEQIHESSFSDDDQVEGSIRHKADVEKYSN